MQLFLGGAKFERGKMGFYPFYELLALRGDKVIRLGTFELLEVNMKSLVRYRRADDSVAVGIKLPAGTIYQEGTEEPVGTLGSHLSKKVELRSGSASLSLHWKRTVRFQILEGDRLIGGGHVGSRLRRQRWFSNLEIGGEKYRGVPFFEGDVPRERLEDPLFIAALLVAYERFRMPHND